MNNQNQQIKNPPVEIISKEPIQFAGKVAGLEPFFKLERWRVKIGDREDDRIIWKRKDFVLVVATTNDKQVVLIREYKQAVEQTLLGLPAGAIEKAETPQAAALRELREETGYKGSENQCQVFGPFFNSPDKSTERHFVVIVSEATNTGPATPEASGTILGVQLCPLTEARDQLLVGLHRLAAEIACQTIG